ncbi:MAG: acyl-CoA carboxylase subunit beta [Chloroflexota bacterium]|nr:acyl-CoA carboxylase subunit beta [Chloroflexota bacterium]
MRTAAAGGDVARIGTKLSARQRLDLLLDPDSWVEDGLLAHALADGYPADGVLTGTGAVQGRRVAVIAHDPTVKAGSWGALTVEKQIRILERADSELLPVFYFVDSAGGRLTDQVGFFPGRRGAARIFHLQVRLSGRVPQICILFGPAAAGGAYMPAFCDWVGMVDGNASMSLASPRVAEIVIGEKVTLEEMGGARMHTRISGCGDQLFPDDAAAIAEAKRLFSYLPQTWRIRPATVQPVPPQCFDWQGLIPENPRASYDIRRVIERLVDTDSFFEIKATYAAEIVTGFARMNGRVVGIVANQPRVKGGALFVDSADKAARFISFSDAFNIPLLFLVDIPGFMVGSELERAGIIRHGAKMISAMASAEVPRFCVVIRKAYAAGFYAMSSPGFLPQATIALPTAQIGAMSAEAAVSAVYAKKIEVITDPEERAAFIAEKRAEYEVDLDLLRLASDLYIDAVVPGELLRQELIKRLESSDGWERESQRKHHSVVPV